MPTPEFEKRPTMRMIASELGVTHATVSMALRNHPLISATTRMKVKRVAKKLGYRPDPEISKLMHHLRLKHKPRFQSTIAALTTISEDREPAYAKALQAAAACAAEALGYGFSVFRHEATKNRNPVLQRVLRNRGVEGVLLLPMREAVALDNLLDWSHFAVVAATYGVTAPEFHRVVPDQYGNTILICKHLARQGCRRIGLVIDTQSDLVVDHRFSAAVMWQNTLGGSETVMPLVREAGRSANVSEWFARERPDAIIAGTEVETHALAQELKLLLPGRIEFAVTERPEPAKVGGIDQRPADIGEAAIAQLHARIQNGEKGTPKVPTVTMIKGRWIGPRSSRHKASDRSAG